MYTKGDENIPRPFQIENEYLEFLALLRHFHNILYL